MEQAIRCLIEKWRKQLTIPTENTDEEKGLNKGRSQCIRELEALLDLLGDPK